MAKAKGLDNLLNEAPAEVLDEKLTEVLNLRFTPTEKRALAVKAKNSRLSMSGYLRQLAAQDGAFEIISL